MKYDIEILKKTKLRKSVGKHKNLLIMEIEKKRSKI